MQPLIWPQQIWDENWGKRCHFGEGKVGPHLTVWPGPRPTSMPSFILIPPTVWPQCTNVRDRTGQTGQRDSQDRQQCDSIGRTVLQISPKNPPLACCSAAAKWTTQQMHNINIIPFWATVCKTVRPMLSVRCLSYPVWLSVCPVCPVSDVGVLWPNGWRDQYETWHAGRPRPWPHC